jgi:hypothetical protein
MEEHRVEAEPGCGTVASAETGAVGPLSGDVPKELELSILGTIRGSAEAEGAATFRGMDPLERDTLTTGIQNSEVGREKSQGLVEECAVRFPAKVNAIPEAFSWDEGAASGANGAFPKIDGELHLVKDCREVGGSVGNLGEVGVVNKAVTSHTECFLRESGLQVDAGSLGTK